MPRPAISRASSWTSGAAERQGPHQGAQKSTRTGTLASRVISANAAASASMGSETGGNAALQEPQRPVSDRCFAGIRLLAPQLGHGRIMVRPLRVSYHGRQKTGTGYETREF